MASKRKRKTAPTASKKRQKPSPKPISNTTIPSHSITAPFTQNSALLFLPSEILTHILSFLLVRADGRATSLRSAHQRRWHNELYRLIEANWLHGHGMPRPPNDILKTAQKDGPANRSPLLDCLLTCRDFYFAGVAAFYGGNVLKFESVAGLAQLAKRLDVDRRRHIAAVLIERDVRDDRGEALIPGEWSEVHDPGALGVAAERLPALKKVVLDFKLGGGAPPFVWGHLASPVRILRKQLDGVRYAVSFAVDGKVWDPNAVPWLKPAPKAGDDGEKKDG